MPIGRSRDMKAVQAIVREFGGPDAVEFEEVELDAPGPGEVLVEQRAIGINFIDVYHRTGLYPAPLPSRLGVEAAGIVAAVGPGVETLATGDRVATFGPARGAYASARIAAAAGMIRLPDDISDDLAAAVLLKGCTTEFLVERCARVEPGWDVLVHAAAGGVGQLLVQWLTAIGARVIASVGSEAKAGIARRVGAVDVLVGMEGVAERVRDLTNGDGVRVSFDGVGKDSWEQSLAAVGQRGLIVSFGNASGPVENVALGTLAAHGSLFITRPTLFDYYVTPEERQAGADRLFAMIRAGKLKVDIGQRYPLRDAAQAHRDLEARRTTGSSLLLP
jgi:NADPH2:quinone reductase